MRSTRTGRWYSVQVKAAGGTVNPWVSLTRFRATDEFLVAVVVLGGDGLPTDTYLIPGSEWAKGDLAEGLGRNDGGGDAGPYVEVRTTRADSATALAPWSAERILATL